MKMKKTILMLSAIMMMAFCLPSCSGDDKDDNNTNNNSNNNNPTETEVETVSLKYLKSFIGMTKEVAQDSLLSKGYTSYIDTTLNLGVTVYLYSYIKVNSNKDTTLFAFMYCYNRIFAPIYATSNNNNSKLLTAFKHWSNEMSLWSNQFTNINYQGNINDSSYTTHNTFFEKLNTMDVSLINTLDESFSPSQTNNVSASFIDRNFDISALSNKKTMRKTTSNPKMIGLAYMDLSSMGKVQKEKVRYIIKNIFK